MTGSECNLKDMHSLQRILREKLRGERFLLVLDDVWNEDHEKWDKLRILLTGSEARGSKVIVTTRSARVASIMGTVSPHLLTGLSNQDCWILFEKRAFGFGGAVKTPNLVAIGKDIVNKCAGLPLAAKALGSLMRFRRGEREWLAVRDNEIWRLPEHENQILPSLRLSYNHLPSRLKPCFAYCSIFPKNYAVRKETLVQLWMAEGFFTHDHHSYDSEDVGNRYIDELVARSLFQEVNEDTDGVVRQVKMHDLIHDLARFVAGEEGSIADEASGYAFQQGSRYLSFVYDRPILDSKPLPFLNETNKLRSFYFIAKGQIDQQDIYDDDSFFLSSDEEDMIEADNRNGQASNPAELSDIFSSLKLLRVLHLSRYPLTKEIPVLIGKMKHLRYLNLSSTKIEVVPPCIGLLHNLQTLNLSCCEWFCTLPESIGQLSNLSTLDLQYCLSLQSLPNSIGCLENLRKLDLSLSQEIKALPESLCRLSNLQVLRLGHCYCVRELPLKMKDMKSLSHLDITDVALTCIPAGIGQLTNLRSLPIFIVGGRTNCSIRELGGLTIEGELDIQHLENVRDPDEAKEANLKAKQGLQSLSFSWDENAYRTHGQSSVGHLHDMVPQADLVDGVLENLQPGTNISKLVIEGYVGKKFPTWMMDLPLQLPNLVNLTLDSCIRCETLPPLGQLPHLKVLKVRNLLSIKCIDSEFYGGHAAFPVLKVLDLSTMLMLEEWRGISEGELFPFLTKLELNDCPNLRSLPTTFATITELIMMNANERVLLSAFQDGVFPNLEVLRIGCSKDTIPQLLEHTRPLLRIQSTSDWWIDGATEPSLGRWSVEKNGGR
ncbi:P-loop containing nucleoside triphosphate hydrolase protein [Dioscorea alata]|uniref:P-loop containing nucleoside triphosphate hydrolase protein n=1 Tax=Dioscorea alata TaxID=55571 RepID=A0ACB7VTA8_DIOAL|nr:P-loop containing nucleoside triphosphate hydrolase protein [Dioscorea alata]